ncbi:hypothetical protein KIPB_015951 [Kipferlia bialata]|uniref:RING-type domain-containing protein n=1 Tax=Kipferlia bialata TaxID=797122 RepID=A0A391NUX0_9EUKA|nr:hypothetical protein KIPB_015951 [Kipferlia bialata]|eukprot:g15951.t1
MDYLDSMGQCVSDRRCVYCKRGSDSTLFLCGHPFCNTCLAGRCLATPLKTPIRCACCDELVYIKNIKECLSKAQYRMFAAESAASFLLSVGVGRRDTGNVGSDVADVTLATSRDIL